MHGKREFSAHVTCTFAVWSCFCIACVSTVPSALDVTDILANSTDRSSAPATVPNLNGSIRPRPEGTGARRLRASLLPVPAAGADAGDDNNSSEVFARSLQVLASPPGMIPYINSMFTVYQVTPYYLQTPYSNVVRRLCYGWCTYLVKQSFLIVTMFLLQYNYNIDSGCGMIDLGRYRGWNTAAAPALGPGCQVYSALSYGSGATCSGVFFLSPALQC
jgi:hypothetical protein